MFEGKEPWLIYITMRISLYTAAYLQNAIHSLLQSLPVLVQLPILIDWLLHRGRSVVRWSAVLVTRIARNVWLTSGIQVKWGLIGIGLGDVWCIGCCEMIGSVTTLLSNRKSRCVVHGVWVHVYWLWLVNVFRLMQGLLHHHLSLLITCARRLSWDWSASSANHHWILGLQGIHVVVCNWRAWRFERHLPYWLRLRLRRMLKLHWRRGRRRLEGLNWVVRRQKLVVGSIPCIFDLYLLMQPLNLRIIGRNLVLLNNDSLHLLRLLAELIGIDHWRNSFRLLLLLRSLSYLLYHL